MRKLIITVILTILSSLGWVGGLILLALIAAGLYGYVENIVKFAHMTLTGHEPEFILRLIGILTGIVGAVVGYF